MGSCIDSTCKYSAVVTTTVLKKPVASVTSAISTNGSYTVSWTDGQSYNRLEQRKNGGTWTGVTLASVSDTSKLFSGMGYGTYEYRARACISSATQDCSADSNIVTVKVLQSPPVTAPVQKPENVSFSVSWPSRSPATSYKLERRKNSGSWVVMQNTSALSYSNALTYGVYYYRVSSCISTTCSSPSAIDSTIVIQTPTLSAPTSSNAYTYFSVGWNGVTYGSTYELQRNGSTKQNTSSLTYSNSLPAGTYNYRVRACNGNGCSNWSNTDTTEVYNTGGCDPNTTICFDPESTDPVEPVEMTAPQTMKGDSEPQPAPESTDGEGI